MNDFIERMRMAIETLTKRPPSVVIFHSPSVPAEEICAAICARILDLLQIEIADLVG